MARVKDNLLTKGMSGKIGGLVFRTRRGKTYVSAAPVRDKTQPATESQIAQQNNFSRCVAYAQHAIRDPQIQSIYYPRVKGGKTVYGLAFSDAAHVARLFN